MEVEAKAPRCFLPPSSTDPRGSFQLPSRLLSLLHRPSSSVLRCPPGFGTFRAFAAWPASPSETAQETIHLPAWNWLFPGPTPCPTHHHYKELSIPWVVVLLIKSEYRLQFSPDTETPRVENCPTKPRLNLVTSLDQSILCSSLSPCALLLLPKPMDNASLISSISLSLAFEIGQRERLEYHLLHEAFPEVNFQINSLCLLKTLQRVPGFLHESDMCLVCPPHPTLILEQGPSYSSLLRWYRTSCLHQVTRHSAPLEDEELCG